MGRAWGGLLGLALLGGVLLLWGGPAAQAANRAQSPNRALPTPLPTPPPSAAHHCRDAVPSPTAGVAAAPLRLYDAALGGTPTGQGFLFLTSPLRGAQATQRFVEGVTLLDSTPVRREMAGFVARRERLPPLAHDAAIRLSFEVQMLSETHAGSDRNADGRDDRAGFSVLLLNEAALGIELAFWEDEIWAQEGGEAEPPGGSLFTHAEGVPFDSTAALTRYELEMVGRRYHLSANGRALLEGPLRDYSAFSGPVDPYETAGLIFLGDNSASAQAAVRLGSVSLALSDAADGHGLPSPDEP